MIDNETKQKIFDAAMIYDVVSDFVNLTKRGSNYVGLCPFHNEKTGSFIVSPSKNIFKCFGCGESGGPVQFVMKHEHLDYPDALRFLAHKFHIDIVEKQLSPEQMAVRSKEEAMYAVNEWALHYFEKQLYETADGKALGYSYFVERGFSEATMRKFSLGYCQNDYHALLNAARAKGFKDDPLLATGLVTKNDEGAFFDKFRGRVMFPIFSVSGRVVGFGGRILTAKSSQLTKYLNSPESEIYQKRRILYGLFQAKNSICKNDCCYLVEGYTDVISMHQSGIENVVASSGTSLTEEQIRLIRRFTKNITVLYDGDFAGIKASLRGIDMLLKEDMNVNVLLLPDGEDPDSFARSHNAVDFVNYISQNQENFIRFKIKILMKDIQNDPYKRADAINNIVETISYISDIITRELHVQEASSLLGVSENVLARQVAEMRKKHFQAQQAAANKGNGSPSAPSTGGNSGVSDSGASGLTDIGASGLTDSGASALRGNNAVSPAVDPTRNNYYIAEQNIVHYLVCYPKYSMDYGDKTNVPLYYCVLKSLKDVMKDGKYFTNDVMNDIVRTIGDNLEDNDEKQIQQILVNSENPTISKIAGDCLILESDKLNIELKSYPYEGKNPKQEKEHYDEITEIFYNRVVEEVSDVVNEYKLLVVKDMIKKMEQEFSEAFNANDLDKARRVKNEIDRYHEMFSILSNAKKE